MLVLLLGYGVSSVQLRRRFPERWRTHAFGFVATGVGATTAGLLHGTDPLVLASMPLGLFGIGLLARKGPIAVLVHDPADEGEMPAETRRARTRFGWMLTVVIVVGAAVCPLVA